MKTKFYLLPLMAIFCICVMSEAQSSTVGNPEITFTKKPAKGKGGEVETSLISGKVTGVQTNNFQIVIYAYAGDRWWVQPFTNSPFTSIENEGNWSTETHLGSNYAVLLVKKSFKPQDTCFKLPVTGNSVIMIKYVYKQ